MRLIQYSAGSRSRTRGQASPHSLDGVDRNLRRGMSGIAVKATFLMNWRGTLRMSSITSPLLIDDGSSMSSTKAGQCLLYLSRTHVVGSGVDITKASVNAADLRLKMHISRMVDHRSTDLRIYQKSSMISVCTLSNSWRSIRRRGTTAPWSV